MAVPSFPIYPDLVVSFPIAGDVQIQTSYYVFDDVGGGNVDVYVRDYDVTATSDQETALTTTRKAIYSEIAFYVAAGGEVLHKAAHPKVDIDEYL